jgi:hypothetical protein
MNQFKNYIIIVFLLLYFLSDAIAQDTSFCSCSDKEHYNPIGVMLDHAHSKGEWMLSYRYMDMNMKGYLSGETKVSDENIYSEYFMASEKMKMRMHMIMLMYGLSRKITLMGMVNYVSNSMYMPMKKAGHSHNGTTADSEMIENTTNSGFGDVRVYALYNLIESETHQLSLNTGISIPTGSISGRGNSSMSEDFKFSYSMQTGTGNFSILPGITYTGNKGDVSWGAQFTSDIKTGMNTSGYKRGNDLVLTAWLGRNWNEWLSNTLRISGTTIGKIHGFDQEIASYRSIDPDADVRNSGGERLGAYAGINFVIPRGVLQGNKIGIEYGIPVYQNLNGVQLKTKTLLNAGWQYSF